MRIAGFSAVAAFAVVLTAAAAVANEAQQFEARSDRYSVEWSGISLGEGTISLAPDGRGCYTYTSTTKPIALVRWTYGSPRELSMFCLRDGEIVSRHFEYSNDKREQDSFQLDFDWRAREVKTLKNGVLTVRPLEQRAYDRFVIREAVRLWVMRHAAGEAPSQAAFTLVDDDRFKEYRFEVKGEESVRTPAGSFNTLRVERIDDPNRLHRYWLAPDRGYVPVKLEHLKKDKVELRMTLVK